MREIKYIVIHCTGTSKDATIESIKKFWKESRGWKSPGYHFLIKWDGTYEELSPLEKPTNGVANYNSVSVHISYIGGIDSKGKPLDTRSNKQKETMISLVRAMRRKFPNAKILGHRDFPGVNKACPSFDVAEWLKQAKV